MFIENKTTENRVPALADMRAHTHKHGLAYSQLACIMMMLYHQTNMFFFFAFKFLLLLFVFVFLFFWCVLSRVHTDDDRPCIPCKQQKSSYNFCIYAHIVQWRMPNHDLNVEHVYFA